MRFTRPWLSQMILVGTDVPDISADLLQSASAQLDEHDIVFGPALDGGFYLIGLRQPCSAIFEGVQWSTDSVLTHCMRNAVCAGLTVAPADSVPGLRDIDTKQVRALSDELM